MALAFIAVGGALGALTRYSATLLWPHQPDEFPMGDFVANLTGCLAMGVLLGVVSMLSQTPERLILLVGTGFLGGLTTFSSYASDAVHLVEAGVPIKSAVYLALTLIFGWLLLRLGWLAGRRGAPAQAGRPEFGPEEMGD